MNETEILHPSTQELNDFVEGRLEGDRASLESHVLHCRRCCAQLEQLSEPDPLRERLRSAIRSVSPDETLARQKAVRVLMDGRLITPIRIATVAPERIGVFRIVREVGRGGMGIVYEAEDDRLRRRVALKVVLNGEFASAEQLMRFRLEAELAARVRHPNIVGIHEAGEYEGRPFLVMEWIDGGSLANHLDGTPWPPLRAAALVETLAHALHAAHCQGVIHRDIKPGNILLAEGDVPRITDFGLARALAGDSNLTQSGGLVGTPRYMAPEQLRGESRAVGPAADIYALGVLFYELLTGCVPFTSSDLMTLLDQVANHPPAPPRRYAPGLNRDLESVCLKCLEKEPARRYATAAALAEDLGRFRRGEPTEARAAGSAERLWKWTRRRPYPAALLVVLALLAVIGLPGVTYLWLSAADAQAKAVSREQDALEARNEVQTERIRLQRHLADLYFDRGLELAHRGEVGTALHWMLEALRATPDEAEDLRRVLRVNLSSWAPHSLTPLYPIPIADVRSVAYSPDGSLLAVGNHDLNTPSTAGVRFFSTTTGQPVGPVIDTTSQGDRNILALAFSPDGNRILVGSGYHFNRSNPPRYARIYDVKTGAPVDPPLPHPDFIGSLDWSPNGKRLVTAADKSVRVWDAITGQLIGSPVTFASVIYQVSFAPDSQHILITSPQEAHLWNPTDGEAPKRLPTPSASAVVESARITPGSRWFVGVGEAGLVVRPWDATAELPREEPSLLPAATRFGLQPDGRGAVTVSHDGRLTLLEFANGQPRTVSTWHPQLGEGGCVAVRPDGRQVATNAGVWQLPRTRSRPPGRPTSLRDGTRPTPAFRFQTAVSSLDRRQILFGAGALGMTLMPGLVCDAESGWPQSITPFPVGTAAFNPKDSRTASAHCGWTDGDYTVRLWDLQAAPEGKVARVPPDRNCVRALRFTSDGRVLVTGGMSSAVRRWDLNTSKPLGPPLTPGGMIVEEGLDVSPDGRWLAAGGFHNQKVQIWDLITGQPHGPPISDAVCTRFAPDGRSLLCWNHTTVQLWRTEPREPILPPLPMGSSLFRADFAPDSKHLLTFASDGTTVMWDAATGQPVGREMRGPAEPTCHAFGYGDQLLIGYKDGTAQVWDLRTCRPLGAPVIHGDRLLAVLWADDDRSFRTAANDGTVRTWPVATPTQADLPKLARALEAHTGLRMNNLKVVSPILPENWQRLRADRELFDAVFGPSLSDAEWHDARAADAESDGNAVTALWHLNQRIAQDPQDWRDYARKGRALSEGADRNAAAAAFREAVRHGAGTSLDGWYRYQAALQAVSNRKDLSQWYEQLSTNPTP